MPGERSLHAFVIPSPGSSERGCPLATPSCYSGYEVSAVFTTPTLAGNDANEWFIIAFEDGGEPDIHRVFRRLTYAGSLRGAEAVAQEVLIQYRVAKRNLWPVWIEIWNPDNAPISRFGDVPEDRPVATIPRRHDEI